MHLLASRFVLLISKSMDVLLLPLFLHIYLLCVSSTNPSQNEPITVDAASVQWYRACCHSKVGFLSVIQTSSSKYAILKELEDPSQGLDRPTVLLEIAVGIVKGKDEKRCCNKCKWHHRPTELFQAGTLGGNKALLRIINTLHNQEVNPKTQTNNKNTEAASAGEN